MGCLVPHFSAPGGGCGSSHSALSFFSWQERQRQPEEGNILGLQERRDEERRKIREEKARLVRCAAIQVGTGPGEPCLPPSTGLPGGSGRASPPLRGLSTIWNWSEPWGRSAPRGGGGAGGRRGSLRNMCLCLESLPRALPKPPPGPAVSPHPVVLGSSSCSSVSLPQELHQKRAQKAAEAKCSVEEELAMVKESRRVAKKKPARPAAATRNGGLKANNASASPCASPRASPRPCSGVGRGQEGGRGWFSARGAGCGV